MEAGSDAVTIRYQDPSPVTASPREKIGGIVYYEPWDWIIWPNVFLDDFIDTTDLIRKVVLIIIISALAAGFIAYELALWFGRKT